MTNYGMPDSLNALWKEILDRHWRYLETEESLEKIDERKKLEGSLREYLSIVSHDKKFLLQETADVLRNSVMQMKDCSPYKLAIGFESISQYANNLFTKPWRKEYRTIKMYSGFYQHEIQANLLNAEKLFFAMGYKMMPNKTMVLEDPICPDQVTNVSRDAMCAAVECQIMKQVNSDLTAMQLPSSWIEIFTYRERHVGDSSNALKGLAYQIKHRQRKSQNENYYNAAPLVPSTSSNQIPQSVPYMCSSQNLQCVQQQAYLPPPHQNMPNCSSSYSSQNMNPVIPPPTHCSVHMNGSVYGGHPKQQSPNYNHSHCYQPTIPIPSLPVHQSSSNHQAQHMPMGVIPHSKSLDQYDNSMNSHNYYHRLSVDHAINLKNQQPPAFDCVDGCSNFSAFNNHPYNVPNNRFPLPLQLSNSNLGMYGGNYYQPNPQQQATPMYNHFQQQQQMLLAQQAQQQIQQQSQNKKPMDSQSDFIIPPPLLTQKDMISFGDKPIQKSGGEEVVKLKSSLRMPKDYSNYRNDSGEKNSGDSFDSFDEDIRRNKQQTPVPSTTSTNNSDLMNVKSQDGIGSYDSWNYVFQNLEKQKFDEMGDVSNPEELEMQFDNLAMSSSNHNKKHDSNNNHHKPNVRASSKQQYEQQLPPPPLHPKKLQSAHQNSNGKTNNHPVQTKNSVQKLSSKSKGYCEDNQNLVNGDLKSNGNNNHKKSQSIDRTRSTSSSSAKKQEAKPDASQSSEWSCRFCTFLNPESVRICQMCAKTRDIYLDSDKNGTATCF